MPPEEELSPAQRAAAQTNLLCFSAFNALSFEILAGQILILFARQVGASVSQIGLLSSLLPFASIIQLGVAPLVNRFGPRALILAGWGARTVVAAGLFLVPVAAARLGAAAATQVLVAVMLGFYLCRALGMSSWLPMIQEIVPPADRGAYLGRQEWLRQLSILGIAVVTALYLLGAPGLGRFMQLMGIGVAAAAWSLVYLWRLPNVGLTAEPLDRHYLRRATAPLRDPIFRRYLAFSLSLRAVLSAFGPFMIVYLRDGLGLVPSAVIAVNTVGSIGAIVTLGRWGRWTDRVGAKPALGFSIGGVAATLCLWLFVRSTPAWQWAAAPCIALLLGIFTGGVTIAMSKFELGFIPLRGRAHYVAINVTAVGLASGAATLAAGGILHLLAGIHRQVGPLVLDRYRLFFLICGFLLLVPLTIRRSLPEERARSLRSLMRREFVRRSRRVRRLVRGLQKAGG